MKGRKEGAKRLTIAHFGSVPDRPRDMKECARDRKTLAVSRRNGSLIDEPSLTVNTQSDGAPHAFMLRVARVPWPAADWPEGTSGGRLRLRP